MTACSVVLLHNKNDSLLAVSALRFFWRVPVFLLISRKVFFVLAVFFEAGGTRSTRSRSIGPAFHVAGTCSKKVVDQDLVVNHCVAVLSFFGQVHRS